MDEKLFDELKTKILLAVDIKHLNTANVLSAIIKGMQIVKDIKTVTNEQKKILLLQALTTIINESEISNKEDLLWIVDELGPSSVEIFLSVASKGSKIFKNKKCCF
jgi:hypothetical protein